MLSDTNIGFKSLKYIHPPLYKTNYSEVHPVQIDSSLIDGNVEFAHSQSEVTIVNSV